MICTHSLCHTLTRVRDSVNNHVTQIHSRKQCKPGKYAGRTDSWLLQTKRILWRGGRKQSAKVYTHIRRKVPTRVRQRECARAYTVVCAGAFLVKKYVNRAQVLVRILNFYRRTNDIHSLFHSHTRLCKRKQPGHTHSDRSDTNPENKSRGSAVSSLPLRSSPSSDISPEKMPARSTDSWLSERTSVLWGGGRKQSGTLLKSAQCLRVCVRASARA
jgi:hypothetical protein